MESQDDNEALERRRAQNRMAQRRFRQRQNQQAITVQLRNTATDPSPELHCPELTPISSSLGSVTSPLMAMSERAEPFDNLEVCAFNTNLDDMDFLDMEKYFDTNSDAIIANDLSSMRPKKPEHQMLEARICGSTTPASFESIKARRESQSIPNPLGSGMEESPNSAATTGWLSPLHMAAQKGHDRIVRMLLQHHPNCDERDSDGVTPLMYATVGGYEDVVSSLLSHGARISSVDRQNRSVLHWAVLHRRDALLKILLASCAGEQAVIDAYDNAGRTALHTAIDTGFEAGVHILLHLGANIHSRARKG